MVSTRLGRTNQEFPGIWLRLTPPQLGSSIHDLASAALEARTVIDISTGPALWGSELRALADTKMVQISNRDLERAVSSSHAADLVQAHLIETLSCIGREWIDFYFLRSRIAYGEALINGALEALESARQEGHVRFFGLYSEEPNASLANWQFHDAFEALCIQDNAAKQVSYDMLTPLASQRRVGVVVEGPLPAQNRGEVSLVSVKSAEEVRLAVGALSSLGGTV